LHNTGENEAANFRHPATGFLSVELSGKIVIAAIGAHIDSTNGGNIGLKRPGQHTREIVQHVKADELRQIVEPERIERVKAEGALVPTAYGVAAYWGRHTKSNLLLIPATRHSFTHLNEAGRVRQKLRR
jgi:hypothetical protein